jgi:hypothetical protein
MSYFRRNLWGGFQKQRHIRNRRNLKEMGMGWNFNQKTESRVERIFYFFFISFLFTSLSEAEFREQVFEITLSDSFPRNHD